MDQVTLLSVALEGLTDAVRVVEEPLVTLDEPEMEMDVTGVVAAPMVTETVLLSETSLESPSPSSVFQTTASTLKVNETVPVDVGVPVIDHVQVYVVFVEPVSFIDAVRPF